MVCHIDPVFFLYGYNNIKQFYLVYSIIYNFHTIIVYYINKKYKIKHIVRASAFIRYLSLG